MYYFAMQHVSFTISNILIVSSKFMADQIMLRAVQEDLNEIENIAGCKALGIINKLVTGPSRQKCETVENIIDLNPVIVEMQRNCNATLLFDRKPGFSDADIHKDNLHDALFQIQNDNLID